MQTNPSVHGRLVVSMMPSELQSAGDVQQTTGLGFEHAAISGPAAASTMNMNSRM